MKIQAMFGKADSAAPSNSRILQKSLYIMSSFFLLLHSTAQADNYEVAPGHKSALFGMGCFWCGEEAFEHYAPGVIEAVSGYAGGTNENPTYRNHPGHYEVVLVEYDPELTSYGVIADYAWRNIDPFNGRGQFCDRGTSYLPAIFYATEEERIEAEQLLDEILNSTGWNASDLQVPLLPRPKFWIAEEYHQDYYIKNPGTYNYYKNGCRRTPRLKEVWGEEVYQCYHDINSTCFETVTTSNGTVVNATVNVKEVPEGEAALLPKNYWIVIGVCLGVGLLVIIGCSAFYCSRKNQKKTEENNLKVMDDVVKEDP